MVLLLVVEAVLAPRLRKWIKKWHLTVWLVDMLSSIFCCEFRVPGVGINVMWPVFRCFFFLVL